jgi:hypothetical protein
MKYKCRTTKPRESRWFEIEAESPEAAANDFHSDYLHEVESLRLRMEKGSGHYFINFALVEVEGHGEMVSRVYHYGIWRRGAKRPEPPLKKRLTEIAQKLGWKRDPKELIVEGWDGEEPAPV